jgi:hypothetical protein
MANNNRMTECKKNIIDSLVEEYGIQSAEDILIVVFFRFLFLQSS